MTRENYKMKSKEKKEDMKTKKKKKYKNVNDNTIMQCSQNTNQNIQSKALR
jgi:hypothetical protein